MITRAFAFRKIFPCAVNRKMASDLRRMLPSVNFSADNFVALENFRSQELESAHVPLPECCPVHPQMQLALFCTHCKVDICTQCVTTGNTHKDHEHIKIEEERQRLVEATGGNYNRNLVIIITL